MRFVSFRSTLDTCSDRELCNYRLAKPVATVAEDPVFIRSLSLAEGHKLEVQYIPLVLFRPCFGLVSEQVPSCVHISPPRRCIIVVLVSVMSDEFEYVAV